MEYIHIYTASSNQISLTRESKKVAETSWLCTDCNNPYPESKEVDIAIQDDLSGCGPIEFINGCGLQIIQKKFLYLFGKENIDTYFKLGTVYNHNGEKIENWVTVISDNRIIVRGTTNADLRICKNCGRKLYFSLGKQYLYPAPPENIHLFESNSFGLIYDEYLFSRIELKNWKKLYVDKLSVLHKPKDGLGVF